jgi:hypothetical protein
VVDREVTSDPTLDELFKNYVCRRNTDLGPARGSVVNLDGNTRTSNNCATEFHPGEGMARGFRLFDSFFLSNLNHVLLGGLLHGAPGEGEQGYRDKCERRTK